MAAKFDNGLRNTKATSPSDQLLGVAPDVLSLTTVNLLTRPPSSHEDPGTGFSFTKAGPRKSLDFGRKKAANSRKSSIHSPELQEFPEDSHGKGDRTAPTPRDRDPAPASLKQNSAPSIRIEVPFPVLASKSIAPNTVEKEGKKQ